MLRTSDNIVAYDATDGSSHNGSPAGSYVASSIDANFAHPEAAATWTRPATPLRARRMGPLAAPVHDLWDNDATSVGQGTTAPPSTPDPGPHGEGRGTLGSGYAQGVAHHVAAAMNDSVYAGGSPPDVADEWQLVAADDADATLNAVLDTQGPATRPSRMRGAFGIARLGDTPASRTPTPPEPEPEPEPHPIHANWEPLDFDHREVNGHHEEDGDDDEEEDEEDDEDEDNHQDDEGEDEDDDQDGHDESHPHAPQAQFAPYNYMAAYLPPDARAALERTRCPAPGPTPDRASITVAVGSSVHSDEREEHLPRPGLPTSYWDTDVDGLALLATPTRDRSAIPIARFDTLPASPARRRRFTATETVPGHFSHTAHPSSLVTRDLWGTTAVRAAPPPPMAATYTSATATEATPHAGRAHQLTAAGSRTFAQTGYGWADDMPPRRSPAMTVLQVDTAGPEEVEMPVVQSDIAGAVVPPPRPFSPTPDHPEQQHHPEGQLRQEQPRAGSSQMRAARVPGSYPADGSGLDYISEHELNMPPPRVEVDVNVPSSSRRAVPAGGHLFFPLW